MADQESFGELNSVGETRETNQSMGNGYGGNNGTGPIGNVYPTGIVATGNEVSARDVYMKGVRRDMSTMRNTSLRKSSR